MALTERTLSILLLTVAAFAAAVGLVLFRFIDPNAPDSPLPGCLFYAATHYYCIGCGVTRCLHALAHGDLLGALDMNPLATIMVVLGPMMLLHTAGWRPAVLQPLMRPVLSARLWLVLLPAYWIARNLPMWPFAVLAPG
ncbi:DUF2752 domain-containing protein [Lysobacter hankyongensis]|uniref:DUF2752 domain-containing protein n=1 Tax=Lysobacter hankyongensis TaxID=1176535 RepID=A0ABP9BGX0_9GAMM